MTLRGKPVVGGRVRGEVLFSPEPISFLGGVDPETGVIIDKKHPLYGKSISGKILVFPHGKGSTVGSYVIYNLRLRNAAPAGMINRKTEPIVAAGAILAEIPVIHCIDIEKLRDAHLVEMDGNTGDVRILE